ncbi:MAG TPA: potassium channel family protein [Candidatus Dormibacteraeota bacterium]|nr:potassium channel family protein [Candidatus Dormibacteraeota bacterium]
MSFSLPRLPRISTTSHLAISTEARYGLVAGLLALSIAVNILASPARWAFIVVSACEGAALIVARAALRTTAVVTIAVAAAALISVVLASLPNETGRLGAAVVDGMLLVAIPVTIGIRVRRSFYVNVQTILAAISVYLVLGLFFAVLDSILSTVTGERFFAQVADADSGQYTYYSFITLCTVGYGDLSPGSAVARALAVTEALIGQLYLVTVIAVVVGNLGRPRQRSGQT